MAIFKFAKDYDAQYRVAYSSNLGKIATRSFKAGESIDGSYNASKGVVNFTEKIYNKVGNISIGYRYTFEIPINYLFSAHASGGSAGSGGLNEYPAGGVVLKNDGWWSSMNALSKGIVIALLGLGAYYGYKYLNK